MRKRQFTALGGWLLLFLLLCAVAVSGMAPQVWGGVVLLLVLVAAQLDVVLGMDYVRAGVCVAFLCNEVISILENAGLMGVPLPAALKNAVELLQSKGKGE